MKEVTLNLSGEKHILELREGQALPLHELKTLTLTGTLEAPGDFLDVRREQFPIDKSHVVVNKDTGIITLNSMDREDVGKITVSGVLEVHPDFARIGINDADVVRSPADLASFIKMNRTFFDSKAIAMNLVSILRQFKATVTKQLEDKKDDRANYTVLREQVVNSNIPEVFNITVPLFVGQKPVKLAVEIVIDPDDFGCALISPDAADMIKEQKEKLLDEQIERFDGYVIIYK